MSGFRSAVVTRNTIDVEQSEGNETILAFDSWCPTKGHVGDHYDVDHLSTLGFDHIDLSICFGIIAIDCVRVTIGGAKHEFF
jgi:hypothetical protein